jgi:hypothetical protein
MIAALVIWVYILFLGYLYGWQSTRLLERHFLPSSPKTLSPSITWITGLAVITTIASLFSLISKIGLLLNIILLIGAAIIILRHRANLLPPADNLMTTLRKPIGTLLGLLVFLSVLTIATGSPANPDTGLYHAQAIRWIETFPAVLGLGNLHTRLAYNSSWLVANATFSFSFLGLQSFRLLPGALYLIALLNIYAGIARQVARRPYLSDYARLALLPFAFMMLGAEVSSPGTDLPAALLTWMILLEWGAVLERNPFSQATAVDIRPVLLTLLGIFTLTVKLSTVSLLLGAACPLFYWLKTRQTRPILTLGLLSLMLISPWFARNVMLSGYLVYPVPSIDLFNPDWKIPLEITEEDRDTARSWARPRQPWQTNEETLAMPPQKWIPIWFIGLSPLRRAIMIFIAAAPFGYALVALILRKRLSTVWTRLRPYLFPIAMAYSGLLYWFWAAPLFRYGTAFILSCLALMLLPPVAALKPLVTKKTSQLGPAVLLAGLLAFQAFFLSRTLNFENPLLPADYLALPTRPCELYNFTAWCAESWDACYYEPFPCVPRADPYTSLRGDNLQEGFFYNSPNSPTPK